MPDARSTRSVEAIAFLASLVEAFPQHNQALESTPAGEALIRIGLPVYRSERWKYSNPKRLYDLPALSSADSSRISVEEGELELSEVHAANGQEQTIVDFEKYPLAAVNALLAQGYRKVVVPPGSHAVARIESEGSSVGSEKIVVEVQEGAHLDLIETGLAANRSMEVSVGNGAEFVHRRLQPANEQTEYSLVTANVHENASYRLEQYSRGSALRRNDICVNLVCEQSSCHLSGAWNLRDSQHLDTQVAVNHLSPNATSRQMFHGAVRDQSRSVFNGRIFIAQDAQNADAQMTNKNILDSERAQAFTKPELEICADEVVCGHGATVGKLDDDALFFFRSRGIDDFTARRLLISGFLREAVSHDDGLDVLGIPS